MHYFESFLSQSPNCEVLDLSDLIQDSLSDAEKMAMSPLPYEDEIVEAFKLIDDKRPQSKWLQLSFLHNLLKYGES